MVLPKEISSFSLILKAMQKRLLKDLLLEFEHDDDMKYQVQLTYISIKINLEDESSYSKQAWITSYITEVLDETQDMQLMNTYTFSPVIVHPRSTLLRLDYIIMYSV